MPDVLQPIKNAVKQTPLWPLIRPRRIHVYGVGAPKTGTSSLARLFSTYRTWHEPRVDQVASLFRSDYSEKEMRTWLLKRDRQWRLECEVGYFLVYFCDVLASEFPEAKFICTTRPPRPWLRSIIDQCINNPRSELPEGYRRLRDRSFGEIPGEYCSQEEPLEKYNLHSLKGYLSYWAFHYRTILDILPPERCLFLRTKNLSHATKRIADFVEVPASRLRTEESHAHKTAEKHGVLEQIDEAYLQRKIDAHCQKVTKRLTIEAEFTLKI